MTVPFPVFLFVVRRFHHRGRPVEFLLVPPACIVADLARRCPFALLVN